MIKLDERLSLVASQIAGGVHLDIGSDHGKLLRYLFECGQINAGIAVENKSTPLRNSQRALHDLNARVLQGDGFKPVDRRVDSVSMCGMGGELIARILSEAYDKLPRRLVLQPNTKIECVRHWARNHEFHLIREAMTHCGHAYVVLTFEQATGQDPAYCAIDEHLADMLGPLLIKAREPHFVARMMREQKYLKSLPALTPSSKQRLACIETVLLMS